MASASLYNGAGFFKYCTLCFAAPRKAQLAIKMGHLPGDPFFCCFIAVDNHGSVLQPC